MSDISFTSILKNYKGSINDLDLKLTINRDELLRLIDLDMKSLREEGVTSLDRVAIIMNSSVSFIINFFALVEMGAVPVLLSKYTTAYELKKFDDEYGINWVVSDTLKEEECIKEFPNLKERRLYIGNYSFSVKRINKNAQIFTSLKGMILQPTSGSTGDVKLCVRDEYGCLAEPLNHIETSFANKGNIFCPLPLNHAYGFGTAFLLSIISSSDLTLLNELNPRKVLRAFNEYKISIFTGTVAVLDLFTKMKISTDVNIPEKMISAGAPLTEEVARNFYNRFNRFIHPSYGSTETGEICLERENIISNTGSTGTPLKKTIVKIESCGDGLGQIVVSNPSMMVGYLRRDGTIDNSLIREDNCFPTGDVGILDGTGRLILNGRLKNMINVFGIKVNPVEVEKVIKDIEGVQDVYVYAGKHRSSSDLVFAVVECSKDLDESIIINICRERLTIQKVPSKVFIVDKVPRNQSGKIVLSQLPK